jgi:cytochrome c oxidase cbb3-type subunit 4
MDLNDLRSAITLVSLLLFVALMAWTWWPTHKAVHDEAERLPFEGDDSPSPDGYIGRSPEGMRAGSGAAQRSARQGGDLR